MSRVGYMTITAARPSLTTQKEFAAVAESVVVMRGEMFLVGGALDNSA